MPRRKNATALPSVLRRLNYGNLRWRGTKIVRATTANRPHWEKKFVILVDVGDADNPPDRVGRVKFR